MQQRCAQGRVDPGLGRAGVGGIDRQSLDQLLARRSGGALKHLQMRPRRFRINVVGGDGRNPAPIVDAGFNEPVQRAGAQIGRRLDVHVRRKYQPRHRDGPQMLLGRRRGRFGHAGSRLGPEVLHDDFLDMPMGVVQVAKRQQRFDSFAAGLADADEDARGEGHALLPRHADGCEARRRVLVGRTMMRPSPLGEAGRAALQHHPLRDRDFPQRCEIGCIEQARIDVRQQAGLLEDEARGFRQIRQRRPMPQAIELVTRRPVAKLRLVAKREQRLLAARLAPGARDGAHRGMRQIGRLTGARRMGKGAVVADVTAKLGQGDEDLAGIGHQRPMPAIAPSRRRLHQQVEIVRVRERERLVGRELPRRRQILEQFSHLAIIHDHRPMAG